MPKVFNHYVASSYPAEEIKGLPGVPHYASRVLASTEKDDAVILPQVVMPHVSWVRDHYDSVGLSHADTVIVGSHADINRFPDHELSVFYFCEHAHAVRPNKRWLETAAFLNSKNNFIELAERLGAPIPETVCINDPVREQGKALAYGYSHPVYLKKAVSASGFGVWKCTTKARLDRRVKMLCVPYQIQASLPVGTRFLNVQYEVQNERLLNGPITLQILKGESHDGNEYPALYDPSNIRDATDGIAKWAFEQGMRGVFAFDVGITPDDKAFVIECNPRWNGSSYPTRVARKLGVGQWESRNEDFAPRSFEGIDLGELAYAASTREGIVIVNWGCVENGKVGVFVAGGPTVRREYLKEFRRQFGHEKS